LSLLQEGLTVDILHSLSLITLMTSVNSLGTNDVLNVVSQGVISAHDRNVLLALAANVLRKEIAVFS